MSKASSSSSSSCWCVGWDRGHQLNGCHSLISARLSVEMLPHLLSVVEAALLRRSSLVLFMISSHASVYVSVTLSSWGSSLFVLHNEQTKALLSQSSCHVVEILRRMNHLHSQRLKGQVSCLSLTVQYHVLPVFYQSHISTFAWINTRIVCCMYSLFQTSSLSI